MADAITTATTNNNNSNFTMGSGHSTTTTPATTPRPGSNDELRREFDKLFADMEFRSKRSAMMNYHEAERYDNR